jgi:hypothetical protein
MAQLTLPPGEYRLPQTLSLGSLSLREGRQFVVTGALGALEHDALQHLKSNLIRQNALAAPASEGDIATTLNDGAFSVGIENKDAARIRRGLRNKNHVDLRHDNSSVDDDSAARS